MNKIKNTEMTFLNTLNVNDEFVLAGSNTVYVCEFRRNEGGRTAITYRVAGDPDAGRWSFVRPGMTTVFRVI